MKFAISTSFMYYVSDAKGDKIGHVEIIRRPNGILWMTNLWVHPDHRKQGMAKQLMSAALQDWYRFPLYLEVAPYTNQPLGMKKLVDFYGEYGFRTTDVPGIMVRFGTNHKTWRDEDVPTA